ncbi:MAG TPA: hypothetical protein VGG75_16020 [Trebonia sp.]
MVTIWHWQKVTTAAAGGDQRGDRRSDHPGTSAASVSSRADVNPGGDPGNGTASRPDRDGKAVPPNPDDLAHVDKTTLARNLQELMIAVR